MNDLHRLTATIALLVDEGRSAEGWFELPYWRGILDALAARLPAEEWERLDIYLVFTTSATLPAPVSAPVVGAAPRTNVVLIADEHQVRQPTLYDGQNLIFQAYYDPAAFGGAYARLFPFPLGPNGHLTLDNVVPFEQRGVNVFFSGNLHVGRRAMFNHYSYLRHLPFALQHRLQKLLGSRYDHAYPASYLRFTSGFAQGLAPADYARLIENSKIVLTPRGSTAAECFRHYEALKCGCIVVSEPLPDTPFFTGSPIIQVADWREGDQIIWELLADPARMLALHHASRQWWEDVLSETAVADYLAALIRPALRGARD